MTKKLLAATALSVSLLAFHPAYAQDESVNARIQRLEEEIQLLKRQQEVEKEVVEKKSEKSANVEIGKSGLKIASPDNYYQLALKGYFQIDGRHFFDDEAGTGKDDILARRLRPTLELKAGDASFRLMPDFAGSSTRIFDAHADYAFDDAIKVRVGKFKPPISLERLQSASDIFFIERGHPNNLAPARDLGVMLYGELIPETLEYQLGVFNGNADLGNSDSDDDDKKDFVGRVFAHPFRNSDTLALQGLGIGIGGSIGDREGTPSKTILGDYRTPGQQAYFKYRTGTAAGDTTYASGTHWRLQPQGYWYYNNYGVLAEYAITSQEVSRGAAHDTLQHTAWQVAGSYVLTGEDVNYKGGVKPKNPFNPEKDGWGALELVARVGETNIDEDAFPIFASLSSSASEAQTLGVGANWYLTENVKLWLDYEHTSFEGGAASGADRPDEQALLSRVQYRF